MHQSGFNEPSGREGGAPEPLIKITLGQSSGRSPLSRVTGCSLPGQEQAEGGSASAGAVRGPVRGDWPAAALGGRAPTVPLCGRPRYCRRLRLWGLACATEKGRSPARGSEARRGVPR